MNITIRAVGPAGNGEPVYIDLTQEEPPAGTFSSDSKGNPILGIALGFLSSVLCVSLCYFCIIKFRRNCNRNKRRQNNNVNRTGPNHNHHNHQQLPGQQSGGGSSVLQCNTDLHEMETLISRAEIDDMSSIPKATVVLVGNGCCGNGGDSNGNGERINEKDNNLLTRKIELKPDTELDEYLEQIPPAPDDDCEIIKCNGDLNESSSLLVSSTPIKLNGSTNHNGNNLSKNKFPQLLPQQISQIIEQQQHSTNNSNSHSNNSQPANGNLRITDNPQYLNKKKSSSSSPSLPPPPPSSSSPTPLHSTHELLDNSQIKLLDTTIDSVDLTDIDVDLNVSNLSTKPLQHTWNYRLPIIGPNG